MTAARLKDGRVLDGAIWDWRPNEGWFSLTDDDNLNDGSPIRIELADCAAVVTRDARVDVHSSPDGELRDELARARRDGWKG